MILGRTSTFPAPFNAPVLNACPFLVDTPPLNGRWVQGSWQPLSVPGAQQFNATQINDQGAVVGYANFPVANDNLDADVRGVIWTQNPALPEIDPSDKIITFSDGSQPYALRAYSLCTDSTTGQDYSVGRVYGFEDNQGVEVINNSGQTGNINSQPNPHNPFPDYLFYQGDGAYFTSAAAPAYLGTANFVGNLGYSPYIEPYNGAPFTGKIEEPILANNNWIVSIESVWPAGQSQGSNTDPDPTIRTITYSSSTSTPGTFTSTSAPSALQQSGVYLQAMTHAQKASDDVVVSGVGYVWNIGSTNAPMTLDDDHLTAINSRYYTPAPTPSNPTPIPVPDFQITGGYALWERTVDATGLPTTPPAYTGTPYAAMIAPNPAFANFGAISLNDSGAIVGLATKLLNSDGSPTSVDQFGNHPLDGILLIPFTIESVNRDDLTKKWTDKQTTPGATVYAGTTTGDMINLKRASFLVEFVEFGNCAAK